ncbi:hypothetical protein Q0N36_10525 [Corynebacterium kefirresidentii]|jgi:hypothetical protein|uniref:Uncharacterized protein n=1 Tax=Corynebacterium kefirresidentii TaxID=1979527 RepID=A0ABT8Q6K3_9CORY|nr:hypothetical protein [Corynebacterium kefirresidentii]MDK8585335.1 hypothetical protein [Corynebacterium kefirresidentii]MDN8621001.1 hypothetical protein [Corynebacterium kefirresidentii]MDN8641815.1 hypothetical protein [Corynebacterium kefirresidentii]MDV2414796.1 hypothetical protein [Corynebacterium kefirresidentii]
MDLSTIQMHLDNFVTTWEGWSKIVQGIQDWKGVAEGFEALKGAFETFGDGLEELSSK